MEKREMNKMTAYQCPVCKAKQTTKEGHIDHMLTHSIPAVQVVYEYVAKDGKTFDNMAKCKEYEDKLTAFEGVEYVMFKTYYGGTVTIGRRSEGGKFKTASLSETCSCPKTLRLEVSSADSCWLFGDERCKDLTAITKEEFDQKMEEFIARADIRKKG